MSSDISNYNYEILQLQCKEQEAEIKNLKRKIYDSAKLKILNNNLNNEIKQLKKERCHTELLIENVNLLAEIDDYDILLHDYKLLQKKKVKRVKRVKQEEDIYHGNTTISNNYVNICNDNTNCENITILRKRIRYLENIINNNELQIKLDEKNREIIQLNATITQLKNKIKNKKNKSKQIVKANPIFEIFSKAKVYYFNEHKLYGFSVYDLFGEKYLKRNIKKWKLYHKLNDIFLPFSKCIYLLYIHSIKFQDIINETIKSLLISHPTLKIEIENNTNLIISGEINPIVMKAITSYTESEFQQYLKILKS